VKFCPNGFLHTKPSNTGSSNGSAKAYYRRVLEAVVRLIIIGERQAVLDRRQRLIEKSGRENPRRNENLLRNEIDMIKPSILSL
jgi:hypothetical protein